jgi:hypothetical protein
MLLFRLLALFASLAVTCGTARADVYADCIEGMQSGDAERSRSSGEIILRLNSFGSTVDKVAVAECLTFGFGEEYIFSPIVGRFLSTAQEAKMTEKKRQQDEADAAQISRRVAANEAMRRKEAERLQAEKALAAKIEQERRDRELAVWQRAMVACNEIFEDDPNSALTNRVCLDLFLQVGLPEE